MKTVDVVLPAGVDDPRRPSGGNTYDRRICDGLRSLGWRVRERPAPGDWPRADPAARAAVAGVLRGVPDDTLVLLDGLVASAVPDVLVPEGDRLRLVVLVHLPLGVDVPSVEHRYGGPAPRTAERAAERRALRAARAVLVTSGWTRDWLRTAYHLPDTRVSVAAPGSDHALLTTASPGGRRLLCVGAVTPVKGQDVLVEALALLADLDWCCTVVGSTGVDPAFSSRVRERADSVGIGSRVRFAGAKVGSRLRQEYARADLLVAASRTETYGMVVTEALARAIPAVAPEVGGLPEALGRTPGGRRPGVLVPVGDAGALAAVLRRWLTDEVVRQQLRRAAHRRRRGLRSWSETAASVSALLDEVAA